MAKKIDLIKDGLPSAEDIKIPYNNKILKKLAAGKKYRVGNVIFYGDDKICKLYTDVYEKFFASEEEDFDEISDKLYAIHQSITLITQIKEENADIETLLKNLLETKAEELTAEENQEISKLVHDITEYIYNNYEIEKLFIYTDFSVEYGNAFIVAPLVIDITGNEFKILESEKILDFLAISQAEFYIILEDVLRNIASVDEDFDDDEDEWDDYDEDWDDDDEDWDDDEDDDEDEDWDDDDDDDDDDKKKDSKGKIYKL